MENKVTLDNNLQGRLGVVYHAYTGEAKIIRITVRGQPEQKVSKTPTRRKKG
jgi:hypothetical protein